MNEDEPGEANVSDGQEAVEWFDYVRVRIVHERYLRPNLPNELIAKTDTEEEDIQLKKGQHISFKFGNSKFDWLSRLPSRCLRRPDPTNHSKVNQVNGHESARQE